MNGHNKTHSGLKSQTRGLHLWNLPGPKTFTCIHASTSASISDASSGSTCTATRRVTLHTKADVGEVVTAASHQGGVTIPM